jgi:hypothetical protein
MIFGGMVSIKVGRRRKWFLVDLTLQGLLYVTQALGYALNGPAREMLYIRTSADIKFKVLALGWGEWRALCLLFLDGPALTPLVATRRPKAGSTCLAPVAQKLPDRL